MQCPKCHHTSGDDWTQCNGSCPMPDSPHHTFTRSDGVVFSVGEIVDWQNSLGKWYSGYQITDFDRSGYEHPINLRDDTGGWHAWWPAGRIRKAAPTQQVIERPIDMVLFCPACGTQHIDASEYERDLGKGNTSRTNDVWTNPPHRSHLCSSCGHIWRPADVPTNGVERVTTSGQADSPIITPMIASERHWQHHNDQKATIERQRRALRDLQRRLDVAEGRKPASAVPSEHRAGCDALEQPACFLNAKNAKAEEALAAAMDLDWSIGEIANGRLKPAKLSLEKLAIVLSFVRKEAAADRARGVETATVTSSNFEAWTPGSGWDAGQVTEAVVPIELNIIRKWPDGFEKRFYHVWEDVRGFIPNVRLYDLQRVLAEFGFTMTITEASK